MTCAHGGAAPCPECLLTLALNPLPPGTVLNDRFRIVSLAGRGGMGEVYRADDLKLGQPVALKFVRVDSDEMQQRLLNEVRFGRQVSHPNVCRLYDVVDVEGDSFVVMEFVDGDELAALMPLPRARAVEVAREICAGVAASHDRGVIHGDLKPANVMIDRSGHVRIMDFGLATLAHGAVDQTSIAGTPAYMAPEQRSGELSRQSDLYSLGVLLRELFGGDVPAQAAPAINRCIDADPKRRPESAHELLAVLPGADDAAPFGEAIAPMSRRVAWPTFAAIVIAMVALAVLETRGVGAPPAEAQLSFRLYLILLVPLIVAAALMVRANSRAGSLDTRGAIRLALWAAACRMLYALVEARHVASLADESQVLAAAVGRSLLIAGEIWLGYLAIEPYIRRRRPRAITGWRRFLEGRWGDPVVGRDVLTGAAAGIAMAGVACFDRSLAVTSGLRMLALFFYFQTRAAFYALFGVLLLVLLRSAVKPKWIGSAIWVVVAAFALLQTEATAAHLAATAVIAGLLLIAIARFGLLAAATAVYFYLLLLSTSPASASGAALALIAALAAAGASRQPVTNS